MNYIAGSDRTEALLLPEVLDDYIARRYARPLFVHPSSIEYANESIRHSLWAHAFYQMQKAAHKTHWVIIRALAYKWIPHPLPLLAGAHPLR